MVGSRVEWHCFPSAKRKKCNATKMCRSWMKSRQDLMAVLLDIFSALPTIRGDPFLAVYRCIFNPILCIFQESINYRTWPVDHCIKVQIVQLSDGAWNHRHIQCVTSFTKQLQHLVAFTQPNTLPASPFPKAGAPLFLRLHFVSVRAAPAHNGGISIWTKWLWVQSPGHIMFLDGTLQWRLA